MSNAGREGDRYIAPFLIALLLHGGGIALLDTAEPDKEEDDDETEVAIVQEIPETPKPPEPKPPEPKPPEPEPVEEVKAVVKKVEKVRVTNPEPKRTPPPVVPDEVDDDVAGGDPDLPAPGGTFKMPDVVPGGVAMGGVGNSNSSGKGGSGAGTQPGGDGGKGKGTKKPVSIASIKTKAKPINNRDVIGDRRFNDVTGQVVVKLIVDKEGKVTSARVIKKLKPEVDQIALGWARKLRFKPAINMDDEPVASVVNWTFTFRPPS